MKKTIFSKIVAALLVGSMLLAGCGSDDTASSAANSEAASSGTSEATPAVQELTTAVSSTIVTLDPALISTTQMGYIRANTMLSLFSLEADGSLTNALCDSYTISEDGLVYTFKLKEGVLWSDDVPLTSADYVYTLKRAIGYGPTNSYAVRNLSKFIVGAAEANANQMDVADMENVGVKAIDDLTFEITLVSPCPYFLKLFTGGVETPVRADFAPEHESTWSLEGGFPSLGAFKIESISPEESVVCVKNDNYIFAEDVTLEKLTYLVMTDSAAQLNAFKAGELDIATSVSADIGTNADYANTLYKAGAYTSSHFTTINTGPKNSVPALMDVNVRKALAMSVDKSVMAEVLGAGDYITPLNGLIPYGFQGVSGDFRSEASYLEYDLDAAIALMEGAGYSADNTLKFEYLYSNSQMNSDVAQMLQQFWSQIHVEIELKAVEGGVFYDFVDNGDFQTSRYGNSDSTDPLNYFQIFTTDAQMDGSQLMSDPVYDQMVADAYNITDPVEYAEALHAIEAYAIGEMAYLLPMFTYEPVMLVQENLEGFWTTPGGTTIFKDITVA